MEPKQIFKQHLAQTSLFPSALEIFSANGSIITDIYAKEYIDLVAGFSVNNTGHCHPAVTRAISRQLEKYLHVTVYGEWVQQPQCHYARLLIQNLPEKLNSVFFANSGTEAIEGAIKLAKKYTKRPSIVCCRNSYHGSTAGSLSIIGRDEYKMPFRPLIPGAKTISFNCIDELNAIRSDTAAVIIEPVQGEQGVIVADPAFLHELRKRCNQYGALLIYDEVQTGFFRTGTFFTFHASGLVPDILVAGKAMGAGMPLAGFFASNQIMNVLSQNPPFSHISTFGGHPLSCAAGFAGLTVLLETISPHYIQKKADLFRNNLVHPLIKEIRNSGLLMAVDLDDQQLVRPAIENALKNGVIIESFLFNKTSFRITPSLLISDDEILSSASLLKKTLNKL